MLVNLMQCLSLHINKLKRIRMYSFLLRAQNQNNPHNYNNKNHCLVYHYKNYLTSCKDRGERWLFGIVFVWVWIPMCIILLHFPKIGIGMERMKT